MGTTPEQLAEAVAEIVREAQARVGPGSIGAEQYATGDEQKFETMSLDEFYSYCLEEALDIINYGVMLSLKIKTMQQALVWARRNTNTSTFSTS